MLRAPARAVVLTAFLLLGGRAGQSLAAEPANPPPLIPREVLFGNPERTRPSISPDGTRLAWLAPDEQNVLQVWIQPLGKTEPRKVTADRRRGIHEYLWAEDDRTLLYLQDSDGDENFHVFGADLETGNVRDLTPFQGVRASIVSVSPKVPDSLLVALNLRDRRVSDVHVVDMRTGEVDLQVENPGDVVRWIATDDMEVRGAEAATPDGGTEIRVRRSPSAAFSPFLQVPFGDRASLVDFSADGKRAYLLSSVGANTVRLVSKDLLTGKEHVIVESPDYDASAVILHRRRHAVEAVDFPGDRQAWSVVESAVKADFEGIRKLAPGSFSILGRDRADRTWVVGFTEDRGPRRYFTWDRASKRGTLLFSERPALEGQPLAEMKPVQFASRDGLVLHGYLTLPPGAPPKGLPLVLFVHGGPATRNAWGYDADAQWLANRGYAVLQVNFRGSTGYGKRFQNAGNKEWGRKMQDDLADAVRWAAKEGTADSARVAILGGSYGGYAALAGAAFAPDAYRCAVDLVGPSNLFTLLASLPPYSAPLLAELYRRIGDPRKDEKLLRDASPLFSAASIKVPVLIGQGANDPVVRPAESEQIVAAIAKSGGAVTYVLYPDEGHGFARPENALDFTSRAEAFLAACLGGRLEPLQGDGIPGSTAQVTVVKAKAAQR